jgi:hypothetical protein
MRGDRTQALLDQLGVKSQMVNMNNCQRFVANRIAGRQGDAQKGASARLAGLAAAAADRMAECMAKEQQSAPDVDPSVGAEERLEALLAAPVNLPDEAESAARKASEKAARVKLRESQIGELVTNLDNYISLGRITAEDAERLRKSQQVDKAMREGKIDNEKGSKIRNTLMSGNARDRIDKGVKEALDFSVVYLQVFEALGRIDVGFDGALKFLVRHGSAINEDPSSQSEVPAALGPVVEALMMDSEVLRPLIDLMDRKESEVRMIAARLPPYSLIVKRDQGRVERVAIDEEFITQLRQMSVDDVAEELHSANRKKRARPAAAMLTLTVLINRLIKRTPFRKKLRLLKINLVIEEFYHATEDVDLARQRATDFLKGRLRSLFPDMSREETEELQRRGEEMVQRVEDKVLAERAARKAKQACKTTGGEEGDEENDVLTEEEQCKGVQIQCVSVRIAGRVRQMRYRIMPEKEGSERYVIGRKDPESGEMAPVLRRGKPRYVDRARDGSWELARE